MPRFEKLRISLARDEKPPIVAASGHEESFLDRPEFLRQTFSEPRQFMNERGTKFNFLPIEGPAGYAAGFFAKERPVPLKHEDLTPYIAENFEPALFIMSLDRAQVAWMEEKRIVGSPKRILETYFDFIRTRTELKDWVAFVRYFEREDDY